VRSALGSTIVTLLARAIALVCTLLVTRWLTPAEQGEVNVAYVSLATASVAASLGIQPFLASRVSASRETAFHAFVLAGTSASISIGLAWAIRIPLTELLGAPGSLRYFPGFAVALFLDRLVVVPRALMARELRFAAVGARIALGELVYSTASVLLAARGWGGAALVAAALGRSIVLVVAFGRAVDPREYLTPTPLRSDVARELVRYGVPLSLGAMLHQASASWDNLLVHARFGASTLGLYNQAYRLADLPATQLGEQLGDLLVPSFARVRDHAARARFLEQALATLGLVIVPLAIGIGAVAPTVTEALLPPSYRGVGPLLTVLCGLGVVRSVAIIGMGYLQVVGRTRELLVLDAMKLVAVLGSMILLAPLGPGWAAGGAVVGHALHSAGMLRALALDGFALRPLLEGLARPLVACAPLAVAVGLSRWALAETSLPPVVRLLLEIIAGASAYVAGVLVVARPNVARLAIHLRRSGRTEEARA
jgi:lipopolysaccharide exporter